MKHILKLLLFLMIIVSSLFSAEELKILTPEEAFKITALQNSDGIVIDVVLGEKIYLYDDKLKLELVEPKIVELLSLVQRPQAVNYQDAMAQRKSFKLKISRALFEEHVKSGSFTLKFSYQGCSEIGLCYQPMESKFIFNLDGTSVDKFSEQDTIANTLASGNFLWILLTFFGFGLLLSLTPCVFPMIPILSSIIVSRSNDQMSIKKGFLLSLVYVLAMAVAYTMAGVLAGLFGANLQASLQNPWVIGVFSAIFVLLALSMFGFYEIQIPKSIQTKLSGTSGEAKKQGVWGIAIMGFLSALIVGPCVAAPMAGALIYIGQSGDALLGGIALFVMSLGMGVPLLVVGATAGKYMPKPGGWMQNVSTIFGVMMLGVAIWMLSRILPLHVSMFLWTVLVLISSIYLGSLEPLKAGASGWAKFFKSLVVMIFLYGVMLFVGFVSGANDPLNPLERLTNRGITQEVSKNDFVKINNIEELNLALKASKKPVILDFYADWCVSCVELEKFTFSDARVKEKFKNFTLLQADVTKNSAEDKALQKVFGIFGPPAILFFKDGKELNALRVVGFKNAEEFLAHLESTKLY